jgi:hypothetical protein
MKSLKHRRERSAWQLTAVFLLYAIGLTILLAFCRPSEASESDKTVTEGYRGSERVRLIEEPVRAKSGETITYGYIGNQRVRVRTTTDKSGTKTTRGWQGSEYVRTKEAPSETP